MPDRTQQFSPFDEGPGKEPGKAAPDETSVLPEQSEPAWAGRAQVRAPQPVQDDWAATRQWDTPAEREPGSKWWMPIVAGIVGLLLLGALGYGIYLITSADEADGPVAPSQPVAPPPTRAATSKATTPPTRPATTEPVQPVEATVPALVGLSQQAAEQALQRSGLASRVIFRDSDDSPPGTVIDSDPVEGKEVPPDTRVTLVIARPVQPAPPSGSPDED